MGHFLWGAVKGTEAYDLEYGQRGSRRPTVERVEKTIYATRSTDYHFIPQGWYWRVRAIRDGVPMHWSLRRPFDLAEPE